MAVAQARTRAELLRFLALNVIADDYENLTISIAGPIVEIGAKCGLSFEKLEIVKALTELVEGGLAKVYRLHGDGRRDWAVEMLGMPSLEEMEDFNGAWFYITDAGLEVVRASRDAWPLDDHDELRKDWTPPLN
jgi:hypothetical protein